MPVTDTAVYDHLRSTDPDDDDSIYRVVGTAPDRATLLRVSDGDGRRANTGEVIVVSGDALDSFESAPNPDDSRSLPATLRSVATGAYWSLRGAPPLQQAAFAVLGLGILAGVVPVPGPDWTADALLLLGAGGLVASWLRP